MQHLIRVIMICSSFIFGSQVMGQEAVSQNNPDVKEAVISSTHHDFGETLINGKMKAPNGFVINGNKSQALTQMIKLRSDFRPQLRNSKFGARSVSH